MSRQTVGQAIARFYRSDPLPGRPERLCAALGVSPDALVANLVALTEGQYVVARRRAVKGDRCLNEDGDVYELMYMPASLASSEFADRPVVLREAVETQP